MPILSICRFDLVSIFVVVLVLVLSFWSIPLKCPAQVGHKGPSRFNNDNVNKWSELRPAMPCIGPRGKPLTEISGDLPRSLFLEYLTYPSPVGGSYETLGLSKTWMTAAGRYRPYGLGQNTTIDAEATVDWCKIDWATLQDDCLAKNLVRFRQAKNITSHPRMTLPTWTWTQPFRLQKFNRPPKDITQTTGRTAIVVRTWSTYNYTEQDMANLRSLLVEAGLSSGQEYAIFLLVDVKDSSGTLFTNPADYEAALEIAVPPELRNISVLFDESLLEAWYPKFGEHRAEFQIFQPLQLFAQFHDHFDHYWQFEMDVRITGNTLDYLQAVSTFAKAEPRKQAIERSSFRYIPKVHGDYQDLLSAVNSSLEGRGIWGPVRIPDIKYPIGPPPPSPDPSSDNFQWGVGEDADFIASAQCRGLPSDSRWLYRNHIRNFRDGVDTPRLFCPQAVARASWNLLNAVHTSQTEKGLLLPSEATLPSFAMWHGLKISFPPQPWFLDPPQSAEYIDELLNDGPPNASHSGRAWGTPKWSDTAFEQFYTMHPTWRGASDFLEKIMHAWLHPDSVEANAEDLPWVLHRHGTQVFAPNLALHPVKTNKNL